MILWLTYWYPDKENPIRGNFIRAQWKAAKLAGCNVELLFVDIAKGKSLMDVNWLNGQDGEIILQVRSRAWKTIYHTPIWAARMISKKWFLKTGMDRPKIIHSNVVFPAGMLAEQLSRKWNIPFIISEHWSKAARWTRHKLFGKKVRSAFEEANIILPVSNHLSEDLQKALPKITKKSFRVIPNAIDINSFNYVKRELKSKKETFKILGVASLIESNSEIKRVDLALEALAILKRRQPNINWMYTHVGKGDRLEWLKDYSKGLGVYDDIKWIDSLKPNELFQEYAQADILLHPTKSETFGIVVLEAIQTGLNIVTTDIPAFRLWVNDKTGVKTELDPNAIADGVRTLWENPKKIEKNVINCEIYRPKQVGEQIKKVYDNLISSSHWS
jgi:glycosyltransferase involved in cell wall biosynthesis